MGFCICLPWFLMENTMVFDGKIPWFLMENTMVFDGKYHGKWVFPFFKAHIPLIIFGILMVYKPWVFPRYGSAIDWKPRSAAQHLANAMAAMPWPGCPLVTSICGRDFP